MGSMEVSLDTVPYGDEAVLQCACREPAARLTSTKESSRGKWFFKCRTTSCFTWIWEECLMDFVSAIVRRRTAEIQVAMRDSKIDYEWRIHQLEHKIEVAGRELEEAKGELDVLKSDASITATTIKRRDSTIKIYGVVLLACVLAWYFSVGIRSTSAG